MSRYRRLWPNDRVPDRVLTPIRTLTEHPVAASMAAVIRLANALVPAQEPTAGNPLGAGFDVAFDLAVDLAAATASVGTADTEAVTFTDSVGATSANDPRAAS